MALAAKVSPCRRSQLVKVKFQSEFFTRGTRPSSPGPGEGTRVAGRSSLQGLAGNVLVLGLIVVIRTVLSFSLEIEIEGAVPWRRALASGPGTIKQATQTALGPGSH
jgi:hypothetical protein